MEIKRYIKNKVILFSIFFLFGCLFFVSRPSEAAHQNAFICCLIDDMSFQYKTVVFYTGEEIEMQRLSRFYEHDFFVDDAPDDRLDILNYDKIVGEESNKEVTGDSDYPAFETVINPTNKGQIAISYKSEASKDQSIKKYIKEMGGTFYGVEEDLYCIPMSFPSDISSDATAGDINRAYQVSETLGEGFNDALLFINNGESYISTYQLIDAAYGLCTIKDGGYLLGPTNEYGGSGTKFKVNFLDDQPEDEKGYQYNCKITSVDYSRDYKNQYGNQSYSDPSEEVIGSGSFAWKMKKGYKNCADQDEMEDGSHNTIAESYDSSVGDTTYISWEHLFVTAGTLYNQGITYANQADVYSMDALESSVVRFVRNLLGGLVGYIDTFTMEDLIFNNGVRGSSAYYFGTFNKNWEYYLLNMFLIFSAIAVSLVFFLVVRMIMKKNLSTANIYERVSLMEEIKTLLVSLFFISFAWGAIRVAMLLNFKFVGIWGAFADGKTLNTIHSSSVLFSGIVIQFIYFVLEIYINYVYIIRGLVIAALIITSPLFILACNFGRKGKAITGAFLKELAGSIFLQSFHAFIYGMLLSAATGTRGIESIVIVASVIPLTSMFKEVTGSGGDAILKTASGLSSTTVNAGANAIGAATSVAGNAIGKIGGAVGGPVGSAVGGVVGGVVESAGGAMQAGAGIGLSMSGVGNGDSLAQRGISQVGRGANRAIDGIAGGGGAARGGTVGGSAGGVGGAMAGASGGGGGTPSGGSASIGGGSGDGGGSDNILSAYKNNMPNGDVTDTASLDSFVNPSFKSNLTNTGSLGAMNNQDIKGTITNSRAYKNFDTSRATVESGVDAKTNQTFLQQSYVSPGNISRADRSDRETALADAIREREQAIADDKKNNTTRNVASFNRKYGVSYSSVEYERNADTGAMDKRLVLGNFMPNKEA